jgi:hypothetical protein
MSMFWSFTKPSFFKTWLSIIYNWGIKFWHMCLKSWEKFLFTHKNFLWPKSMKMEQGWTVCTLFRLMIIMPFIPVIPGRAGFCGFYTAQSQCPSKFTLGRLIEVFPGHKNKRTSWLSHTGKRKVINLPLTGRNGTGRRRCTD